MLLGLGTVYLNARWHGDNRSWYTGGEYPFEQSRVWFSVQVDTDNADNAFVDTDTGITSVTVELNPDYYNSSTPLTGYLSGKAPRPDPPVVSCNEEEKYLNVFIKADAPNPLVSVAPGIEIEYDIYFYFDYGPSVSVIAKRDRFPWHELYIEIDGESVLQWNQEPTGPFFTPTDLIAEAYQSYRSVPRGIAGCKNSRSSHNLNHVLLNTSCPI